MQTIAQLRKLAEKRVGTMLPGEWQLDAVLDIGGMAAVYRGRGPDDAPVAVKVLHRHYATVGEARSRFLREGFVANTVEHADAVRVLDSGEAGGGVAFLVMELLIGESLEARLQRKRVLDAAEVLYIADRTLDVLRVAHAAGIVHRDIKPPNLFLTEEGRVKVLDFGLARVRERTFQGELTRTGMVIGTASYMPPEQARGKRELIGAHTDIWALGSTMFKALSGEYVHRDGSPAERLVASMSTPAPPLEQRVPEVHAGVAAIVDRSLAFQPSDRYPSAADMQHAVRELFCELTGEVLDPERVPETPFASWMPASTTQPSGSEQLLDIEIVYEPDEHGESIVIEFADEDGTRLRDRIALEQRGGGELPEVSVVIESEPPENED